MYRLLYATNRCLFLLAMLLGTSASFAQIPVGGEFQVNSYTTYNQESPAVAASANGDFVVVWESFGSAGNDSSYWSIQGQRYASEGSAMGGEFQINTYTTSFQYGPAVAAASDGDFVVVWFSEGSAGSDSSSYSIQGQRYASDGSALGGEFQVNTYTTSFQVFAAVAAAADGDFVVVWNSDGSAGNDSSSWSIQGQRYASDGSTVGGEFQVNTYTTDRQSFPAVAIAADGDFVVAWQSNGSTGSDSSSYSIQGQRYASDGSTVGGEFQVNTYTTQDQSRPAVATDADGNLVVVWQSSGSAGSDSSSWSIQGQLYASDGSTIGGEFQINTYTTDLQDSPAVAMNPDGDFVVAWRSNGSAGSDSSSYSSQGQLYASDGSEMGGEFQVNTYTTDRQSLPAVTAAADGEFVIVWSSYGSAGNDSSFSSIQGQRFRPSNIFADGFESGDTTKWSSTVP